MTRGGSSRAATALVAFAVIGLLAALFVLTGGSEGDEASVAAALPVEILVAERRSSFEVERSFVGLVEARRESSVGFELAGQLATVWAEEGDRVRAGQLLAELDTERLRARRAGLEAQRSRAEADVTLARLTRQRVGEAQDLDAVSPQALDEALLGLEAREAGLLEAAAAVDQVDVEIAKSRLLAPFDALVAGRFVDEGQVLSAGTAVVRLLERDRPEARIGVAGDAARALEVGETHEIRVEGRRLEGSVRAVLPTRSRDTRAVEAIFTLDASLSGAEGEAAAPQDGVRSGDLARLVLRRERPEAGFWLPTSALTESSRGLWAVFVVEGEGDELVAARRELEVLHEESGRVYARGTLRDGERVVAAGLHRLVPGQRVEIAGRVDLAEAGP
ncbi:MAG: efflux RND transporter periplasmic adaptor subunit [Acidobacteriota bacterium]